MQPVADPPQLRWRCRSRYRRCVGDNDAGGFLVEGLPFGLIVQMARLAQQRIDLVVLVPQEAFQVPWNWLSYICPIQFSGSMK